MYSRCSCLNFIDSSAFTYVIQFIIFLDRQQIKNNLNLTRALRFEIMDIKF